jgi:uncharacterized cupredoxin-like copper-binding protein
MPARRRLVLVAALLTVPTLAACSSGTTTSGSSADSGRVTVTATDDTCTVSRTELAVGTTTFAVTNKGSKITEVYVYGQQDGAFTKVVSEVENIGPGTSRTMSADLADGTYEVACKPGQAGDGIRTKVRVGTGSAGASASTAAKYDREIELRTDGTTLTGLSGATAKPGEKVEVKLENAATGQRTLEVKRPDGSVAGEAKVSPGGDGEIVVELDSSGEWTVVVEGGPRDVTGTIKVG